MNDEHLRKIRENVRQELQLRTKIVMTNEHLETRHRRIAEKWHNTWAIKRIGLEKAILSAITEATACAEERSKQQAERIERLRDDVGEQALCIFKLEAETKQQAERIEELEKMQPLDLPISQAQSLGIPKMRTWADYRDGCLATFNGGYKGNADHALVFRSGMGTVFNLLENEFPPLENLRVSPPTEHREGGSEAPSCDCISRTGGGSYAVCNKCSEYRKQENRPAEQNGSTNRKGK